MQTNQRADHRVIAMAWRWIPLDDHTGGDWRRWAVLETHPDGRFRVGARRVGQAVYADPADARNAFLRVVRNLLADLVEVIHEEIRIRAERAKSGQRRLPTGRRSLVAVSTGVDAPRVVVEFEEAPDLMPKLLVNGEAPGAATTLDDAARQCWRVVADEVGRRIDEVLESWWEVASVRVGGRAALRLWTAPTSLGVLEYDPEFFSRRATGYEEWAGLAARLRELQELAPEKFSVVEVSPSPAGTDTLPIRDAIRAFLGHFKALRQAHPDADLVIAGRLAWPASEDQAYADLAAVCNLSAVDEA